MSRYGKRVLALFIAVLILAMSAVPILAVENADDKGETPIVVNEGEKKAIEEGKKLKFDENGEFKILIFSDIQDEAEPLPEGPEIWNAALDKTSPDLVVFLGDNQVEPRAGEEEFDEQKPADLELVRAGVRKAIDTYVSPVVKRGIPFAVVFGNHDHEGGVTREEQVAIYQEYAGCIIINGPENITGNGNYNTVIKDRTGKKDVFNLWFIDSGAYPNDYGVNEYEDKVHGNGYAAVRADQIAWYEQVSNQLKQANGGKPLPSMLFQHIIVPQVYDMLVKVDKGTANSIRGRAKDNGLYYALSEKAKGELNESPCPPYYDSGQFDSWVKQGDVVAAFFGHDHTNTFEDTYKDIYLINNPKAGARTYGPAKLMGGRLITLNENNPTSFETKLYQYEELLGKKPSNFMTMFNADYSAMQKIILYAALGVVGIAVGAVAIVFIVKKVKRKKKG